MIKERPIKEVKSKLAELAVVENRIKELDILFYSILEVVEFIENLQKTDRSQVEKMESLEKEYEKLEKRVSVLARLIKYG